MNAQCLNCRYWFGPDEGEGECRFHAPQPMVERGSEWHQVSWPVTKSTDWCGEHRYLPPPLPNEP